MNISVTFHVGSLHMSGSDGQLLLSITKPLFHVRKKMENIMQKSSYRNSFYIK
jgi:hypothetical protein